MAPSSIVTSSLLITKENFNVAYLITVGLFILSIWELLSLCMGIQSNALLHLRFKNIHKTSVPTEVKVSKAHLKRFLTIFFTSNIPNALA